MFFQLQKTKLYSVNGLKYYDMIFYLRVNRVSILLNNVLYNLYTQGISQEQCYLSQQ